MRIIAGKYRSRPLHSPSGLDIRPTSDRLRETLFNVLCAGNPEALRGSAWLDLFAGTGGVGIEALSRGAAKVTFVESLPKAVRLIEKNLASLRIETGFQVLKMDVTAALKELMVPAWPVDFVFLDPPYRREDAYDRILTMLECCQAVGSATTVVAEHDRKFDPGAEFGSLQRYRKLEQGDASLSFYRRSAR